MSLSEGAFETTLPVAAHIPGGGSAFMSLIDAARRRLEAFDATEAAVEERCRGL